MDKQLIELIAKSPDAVEVALKYIDYMYFEFIARSITITGIFIGMFYFIFKIAKWLHGLDSE